MMMKNTCNNNMKHFNQKLILVEIIDDFVKDGDSLRSCSFAGKTDLQGVCVSTRSCLIRQLSRATLQDLRPPPSFT